MSLSSGAYLGSHSTLSQCAGGERRCRGLADVDRPVVEHDHDGLAGHAGLGAIEEIEYFQQPPLRLLGDAVTASARFAHSSAPIMATFLRLPRGRHAPGRATFGPGVGELGMRLRLALVGEQQQSPTSAWCLRSLSRNPTRSISSAI